MKQISHLLLAACVTVGLVACSVNTDNNGTYDEPEFAVNFSASSLTQLPEGASFGILGTCTRGGVVGSNMSEAVVAKYNTVESGTTVRLVPASDSDRIVNRKGDHNYNFIGVYPFPEGTTDIESIAVSIPSVQVFEDGIASIMPMIASASPTNVIPTVEMSFASLFSVLEFSIPSDPVLEDEINVVKSMKFRSCSKQTELTTSGTINANTRQFQKGLQEGAKEVMVDFGSDGFQVPADGAKVQMLVAPFTVPEDGMEIEFELVDSTTNILKVLSQEANTKVAGGESMAVQVSRVDDGIIPVTFPVYFPIGYPKECIGEDGKTTQIGYCNKTNQPNWVGSNKYLNNIEEDMGVFKSVFQPQATCKWHWVNEGSAYCPEGKSYYPFLEYTGGATGSSTYFSCVGIKGIWTGDYFEFDLPVKKFKADTKVQFTFAVCNKNAPTFWEVKYLDGEEWKTTAKEGCLAPDGITTAKATWAIPYDSSQKMSVDMTFTKAIVSGHLLVRLVCVDGSITSSGVNAIKVLTCPAGTSSCNANFYTVEKDPEANAAAGKAEGAWTIGKRDQSQSISFSIL